MGEAIFRRVGKQLLHTPVGAITANDVVVVGTMPLVAERDIAAGGQGSLTCEGIFEVLKDSSVFTAGDKVYWDEDGTPVGGSATGAATVNSALGNLMGVCETAELTGALTVHLKLTATEELGIIVGDMTAGAGITAGVGTICSHSVVKIGDVFKTEILLDLTGLDSSATDGDIIGVDDTGAAYIGQITAANNGTIVTSRISCFETPAGGDDDIAIYSAEEATGVEDSAIGDLTETSLLDHGAWAADEIDSLDTVPVADGYLYLVAKGGDTAATYTAGKLLIELWGV